MTDERIVGVIADALWEIGDKQEAEGVLAALRGAGFDIYRCVCQPKPQHSVICRYQNRDT